MNDILFYLIKVCLFQSIVYFFYWIALRHTTFHQLNRLYLLAGLIIPLILPAIKISAPALFNPAQINHLLEGFDETIFGEINNRDEAQIEYPINPDWKLFIFLFYCGVSLILLIRTTKGFLSIYGLRRNSYPEKSNGIPFFIGKEIRQPFSFLQWIFIPEALKYSNTKITILKHEKAHADQWHTLDLLFVEFIIVVLWFNPFVFLFRQSLKQVHEYLADSKAIEDDEVKADYLNSIVSQAKTSTLTGIASQFYWLTLKKRINMITKNKTIKLYKLCYLLIVPMLIITILAFSNFSFVAAQPVDKTENIPCILPIKGESIKTTSGYGMRKHPITNELKMHYGVDFSADRGTPVHATADGLVVKTENKGKKSYGKLIVVQHDQTYSTLYSQLSEFKVNVGDKVKQGDIIGLVGNSGFSTWPHLHYEVWKNGEKVNPAEYFE